jgi:soluble lytic murein transglycosylase-like protein
VQYWAPKIMQWSQQYGVDPDILATVIQLESCGDWQAGSGAGAQGLFQVMPFHFAPGEDMHDPDTNARRGIAYLKGGLIRADGHVGLAMAGYNGGWGVIDLGWGGWYRETRLYYVWGSQIYLDALRGKKPKESAALQNWLNAGGVNLCLQAAAREATPTPGAVQSAQ